MRYFLIFLFLISAGILLGIIDFLVNVVPEPLLLTATGLGALILIRAIAKARKN